MEKRQQLKTNYTPVASSNLFSGIIRNRIKKALEKLLREAQAGFRENRSCRDIFNKIRIILGQPSEWNTTLRVAFIDFEKSFGFITTRV